MARTPVKKIINDHVYLFSPLSATDGLTVQTLLIKNVGEAAAQLFGGIDLLGKVLDQDVTSKEVGDFVAPIMAAIRANVNAPDIVQICKTLSEVGVTRDDKPVVFDVTYMANYAELFAAVRAAIEVNFGPLLDALRTVVGTQALAGRETTESSRSTSTSESGA